MIGLLQTNLIPKSFAQTWFKKSKAHHNLWLLSCWLTVIFLCFLHDFFLPESTTKKHLHHRFLLVLLKEEVCILHPSSKFSTSVSLELHRAIFFFKGNFYLHVYIHTSDSCTFLHVQRSNEGKHIYYICTYNPISPVTNRRVWLTTSVKIIQYIHKRPLSDLLFGC